MVFPPGTGSAGGAIFARALSGRRTGSRAALLRRRGIRSAAPAGAGARSAIACGAGGFLSRRRARSGRGKSCPQLLVPAAARGTGQGNSSPRSNRGPRLNSAKLGSKQRTLSRRRHTSTTSEFRLRHPVRPRTVSQVLSITLSSASAGRKWVGAATRMVRASRCDDAPRLPNSPRRRSARRGFGGVTSICHLRLLGVGPLSASARICAPHAALAPPALQPS